MQIFLSAYLSTFRNWTLHQLHTYHFKRNRISLHAQEMSFWAWIKMEIRFVSWLLLYYQVLLNILNYLSFVICHPPPTLFSACSPYKMLMLASVIIIIIQIIICDLLFWKLSIFHSSLRREILCLEGAWFDQNIYSIGIYLFFGHLKATF